ncbi:hypothetical protein TWF192_003627 [Orbilia oligospora]|nr:hypothetical protein TWF192_003627 [Orbilia oligospora]
MPKMRSDESTPLIVREDERPKPKLPFKQLSVLGDNMSSIRADMLDKYPIISSSDGSQLRRSGGRCRILGWPHGFLLFDSTMYDRSCMGPSQ